MAEQYGVRWPTGSVFAYGSREAAEGALREDGRGTGVLVVHEYEPGGTAAGEWRPVEQEGRPMTEPWNLTEPERRQLREAQAAAKGRPPSKPCPECGCVPNDTWGCKCTNPDCPCSEEEDEDQS